MIVLQGHSLAEQGKFTPQSMSLTLEERTGSAVMQLGPEDPELAADTWLLDEREPCAGICWRVRMVDDTVQSKSRSVTLEHLIATLKDRVIFGTLTASDMGGGETVSARTAANYVLSHYQSDWRLGNFGFDVSAAFEFTGDSVFSALETICSVCEDAEWTYDMSTYPFVLNIMPRQTTVTAELRGGRNLTSMKRSIDRSGMYTRIYPIGQNDLHLSETYLSKNENLYGRIERVETDSNQTSEAALRSWAWERLNNHCEPKVTITIQGLELSQATGESLDKMAIGKQCQAPLPEYATTIVERIVRLQWRDKIGRPNEITVTLANTAEDVVTILRREQNASHGGGGAKKAKKEGEDHAWFVDTDDHVAMVAEAVAGEAEGGGPDWSRVAEIVADGNGIHQRVVEAEGELVTHQASIENNGRAIELEVTNREDSEKEIKSSISVQADKIALLVDAGGNIKPASIVAAINNGASSIVISANHIDLDGIVKSSVFQNAFSNITSLKAQALTVEKSAYFSGYSTFGKTVYLSSMEYGNYAVSWKSKTVVASIARDTERHYLYANTSGSTTADNTKFGSLVTGHTTTTIYYLGR